MKYKTIYISPLGNLILTSDGKYLTGIFFNTSKSFTNTESEYIENDYLDIFINTKKWLDKYFNHEEPKVDEIPIKLIGSDFCLQVWEILKTIGYGKTITYGDIAKRIADNKGIKKMSSQAVGNAIGKNPIPIIIPCHRVIGSNGKLIGYSAGLDKKIYLLNHENKKLNNA